MEIAIADLNTFSDKDLLTMAKYYNVSETRRPAIVRELVRIIFADYNLARMTSNINTPFDNYETMRDLGLAIFNGKVKLLKGGASPSLSLVTGNYYAKLIPKLDGLKMFDGLRYEQDVYKELAKFESPNLIQATKLLTIKNSPGTELYLANVNNRYRSSLRKYINKDTEFLLLVTKVSRGTPLKDFRTSNIWNTNDNNVIQKIIAQIVLTLYFMKSTDSSITIFTLITFLLPSSKNLDL